jgi:CheY-like chemotaxis protein
MVMALKVLAVDDSKTIRMIVKKAFKSFDCVVVEAANGKEGLAMAAGEKPDLIVLDITMPVMTGVEMLDKLKADPELADTPVIMLTAESGKDNVMQILKMGVRDYMVKPFKGPDLIERVKKILTIEEKDGTGDDPGAKYFSMDGDIQVLSLPRKIERPVSVAIEGALKTRIVAMKASGISKFVLNLNRVQGTNVTLIKLIIKVIQSCQKEGIHVRVMGTEAIRDELKDFQETSEVTIDLSMEEVKAAL